MNSPRHLKAVPDPLWKRALRNRKHWDNHQLAVDAFELARKLAADRKVDEEERLKKIRDREAAKQRQVQVDKALRVKEPPIEPLTIQPAGDCPSCGKAMAFKPGIARAVHVEACRHRVIPRCATPKCPKPAASANGLCALCTSRARRKVIDTPSVNGASEKTSARGSDDGS